jgi:hypothetical protein
MRHGVMATPGQDGTTHDYYYDVRIIMYESSYPVTVHTPLCTFFFAIVDITSVVPLVGTVAGRVG